MKALRIGVIGAGGRGVLADFAHKPERNSHIVAGCDVRSEALDRFKKKYGENSFTTNDYRELLDKKDIDAVFVCTPDYLHEKHAIAALRAGKAVYLEKPMTITIKGCDKVLRTAKETGSKLYVGHNMRHFPVVLKMKEIIDSGAIGEIQAVWCRHFIAYGGDAYFKDWHSERKNTTGLLLQKAAHDIDVIHWLAGAYASSVVGMGKLSVYNNCQKRNPEERGIAAWSEENWPPLSLKGFSPVIDVEDHSMIMMQLQNGVQVSYTQCHYTPDSERNYTFIGTCGRVENVGDWGKCQVHVFTKRSRSELEGGKQKPDIVYPLEEVEGSHGGADPNIVTEFLDFLQKDIKTNTNPIAARYSVAAGVMGTKSIRGGSCLKKVPVLDKDLYEYFENGQKKG
jgi:predicted dehydrogenase